MRMRKKPNLEKRIERCSALLLATPEELRGCFREKFGFSDIRLEIGCGKGRFITESAKLSPDTLFIGIERERGALVIAMEKAMEASLSNVLFLDCDAARLEEIFAPEEISGIYLNFSDPWPKKKQAKRRLTHENFLVKYEAVLKKDGFIYFKTDNRKLFEFSLNSFADYGLRLKNITFDLAATDIPNVVTEYEAKFMELGMCIYRVEAYLREKESVKEA